MIRESSTTMTILAWLRLARPIVMGPCADKCSKPSQLSLHAYLVTLRSQHLHLTAQVWATGLKVTSRGSGSQAIVSSLFFLKRSSTAAAEEYFKTTHRSFFSFVREACGGRESESGVFPHGEIPPNRCCHQSLPL